MENRVKINNLADLRLEKQRLRLLAREQENYLVDQYSLLRKKVSAPMRLFNTIGSYVPGIRTIQAVFSARPGKNNSVGAKIINVLIPLLANRFLPRKTGMMTRGVFSFLAKQVTALLTSGKLAEVIAQIVSTLQRPSRRKVNPFAKQKRGRSKTHDFGIPPDSETY